MTVIVIVFAQRVTNYDTTLSSLLPTYLMCVTAFPPVECWFVEGRTRTGTAHYVTAVTGPVCTWSLATVFGEVRILKHLLAHSINMRLERATCNHISFVFNHWSQ